MNTVKDGNGLVEASGVLLLDSVIDRIKGEAIRDADAAIEDKERNAIIAAETASVGEGIESMFALRPKFSDHEKAQIRQHYCNIRLARLGDELVRMARGKDRLVE